MAIRARVPSNSNTISSSTSSTRNVSVKAVSIGGSGGALSALSDVDIDGTPEDGGVLSYDSASGKFVVESADTNITTIIGGTF